MAKKFKKTTIINVPIEIAYKFIQQMFGDMIKSKNEYLSLKRFKYSEIDGETNKRYIFQSKYLFTRVLIDCEFARLSDKKRRSLLPTRYHGLL